MTKGTSLRALVTRLILWFLLSYCIQVFHIDLMNQAKKKKMNFFKIRDDSTGV